MVPIFVVVKVVIIPVAAVTIVVVSIAAVSRSTGAPPFRDWCSKGRRRLSLISLVFVTTVSVIIIVA